MNLPDDELAGLGRVRLGVNERTILMASPVVGSLLGLLIAAPEQTRSAQQGYLRAVGKLVGLGLIERRYLYETTRAHDPRLEQPFYKSGRFWKRAETTRSHRVRRVVTWATPFGEGIKLAYGRELTSRRPIRWRADKIANARRYSETFYINPEREEESLGSISAMLDQEPEVPRAPHIEAFPEEADSPSNRRRWRLAVRSARRAHPNLGAHNLWEAALRLYLSECSTEALRATGGPEPASPNRPALKFTRGELGNVLSTDPEIARRALGADS